MNTTKATKAMNTPPKYGYNKHKTNMPIIKSNKMVDEMKYERLSSKQFDLIAIFNLVVNLTILQWERTQRSVSGTALATIGNQGKMQGNYLPNQLDSRRSSSFVNIFAAETFREHHPGDSPCSMDTSNIPAGAVNCCWFLRICFTVNNQLIARRP
jgi:hypothetical protein